MTDLLSQLLHGSRPTVDKAVQAELARVRAMLSKVPKAKFIHEMEELEPLSPENTRAWVTELRSCKNLDEIRQCASRRNISLKDPAMSRFAFQRLLVGNVNIFTYLEFLADRQMNPPKAQNLAWLVRSVYWQYSSNDSMRQNPSKALQMIQNLESWVRDQVALGLLTEEEIRSVLDASKVPFDDDHTEPWAIQDIVPVVWKGITTSKIRKVDALEDKTIFSLLISAAKLRATDTGISMASEIITELYNSTPKTKRLSKLAHRGFGIFAWDFVKELKEDMTLTFNRGRTTERDNALYQLLGSFPERLAHRSICGFILRLMLEAETSTIRYQNDQQLRHLDLVEDILRGLGNRGLVSVLKNDNATTATWTEIEAKIRTAHHRIRAAYLQALPDARTACLHVLDNWIIPRISALLTKGCDGKPIELSSKQIARTRSSAARRLEITQNSEVAQYQSLLEWIQATVPVLANQRHLRRQPRAVRELNGTLFSIAQYFSDSTVHLKIAQWLNSHNCSVPCEKVTNTIESIAPHHPQHALALFLADERIHLEQCPVFAIALIETPDIHTNVIFTLLHRTLYESSINEQERVRRLLSSQTASFLRFLADRLSRSQSHSKNRALRTLRRTMKLMGTPRALLHSKVDDALAQRYRTLSPTNSFDLSDAFGRAAVSRWLSCGGFIPRHLRTWIIGRVYARQGPEEAERVAVLIHEWESRNGITMKARARRVRRRESGKLRVREAVAFGRELRDNPMKRYGGIR